MYLYLPKFVILILLFSTLCILYIYYKWYLYLHPLRFLRCYVPINMLPTLRLISFASLIWIVIFHVWYFEVTSLFSHTDSHSTIHLPTPLSDFTLSFAYSDSHSTILFLLHYMFLTPYIIRFPTLISHSDAHHDSALWPLSPWSALCEKF